MKGVGGQARWQCRLQIDEDTHADGDAIIRIDLHAVLMYHRRI